MPGFSGATGVPLKQMQDAIAQSTALETITIPSANFNSSLTVDTSKTYCNRSGRFGFLYIEAKANADITAWATLLSALPVRGKPMQTNGAYTMNLGNNVVVCNMNADGLINTPAAISNGTNVRIAISYMCQQA